MIQCWTCTRPKDAGKYLCSACWFRLSLVTRTRLNKRDSFATVRVLELRRQTRQLVPLADIEVTP